MEKSTFFRILGFLLPLVGTLYVSPSLAQLSADEQILIQTLDKAFTPRLLSHSNSRKNPDGTYSKTVTLGDALTKQNFDGPLRAIRVACTSVGGTLTLLINAGNERNQNTAINLTIDRSVLTIDRQNMWSRFSAIVRHSQVPDDGFTAFFSRSAFRERATRSVDSDPPFGLFSCESQDKHTFWAAVVMPTSLPYGPYGTFFDVTATPVTAAWIKGLNNKMAADKRADELAEKRLANELALKDARAKREEVRLRPFRADLAVGSRTNCGLVIAVRNPLVQVQLPPNILGLEGNREFWVARDQLTDARPPDGCKFGGQ